MTKARRSSREVRNAIERQVDARYELCLFVAGTTPLSSAALTNLVALCDERLPGQYDLTVVDVYKQPGRAKTEQVVAVPTLIRKLPLPMRRIVGDLSDSARVIAGLGLRAAARVRNTTLEGSAEHDEKP